MARPLRKPDAPLIELLAKEPWNFTFFRAVQIIHAAARHAVPVGELGPPNREAIRLVHEPSLIFHASDIASVKPRVIRDGVSFVEVTSTFLGLFGTVSPLATFTSEEVLRAEAAEEYSLKAFYDIFHHRLLSLVYRAWKKYRFHVGARTDGTDAPTSRALTFVGVDVRAVPKAGLPANHLLALASLLSIRTRPARSLEIILERMIPGAGIFVQSFISRRVALGDDQVVKLGQQNSGLGVDFTVGRSVVDRSGRFRVGVGPVDYETFEALMPGGRLHATMRQVIDQFSRGELEVECEISLDRADTPKFELGTEKGGRLGVTTRLQSAVDKPMRTRFVMSQNYVQASPTILDDDRPPVSIAP